MINKIKQDLINFLEEKHQKRNPNLSLKDLPHPSLIPNMEKAAKMISERIKENKRILIVGDYDADGIMATSILKLFFNDLGVSHLVSYIIPDRFKDGYGVSQNIIDYALNNDFDFIVTVDNGIGAIDAVKYAKEHNITVIITDHHLPGEKVPNADLIVDLKYNAGKFPYIEISGATIAWYLAAAIRKEFNAQIDLRKYLDLVAITVISDVMPLEDINLVFYKAGLERIKKNPRPFEILVFQNQIESINEMDLGFKLIPMLNATGRIAHASIAVELVTSTDFYTASKYIQKIKEINEYRKELTNSSLQRIMNAVEEQKNNSAIIIKEKNLHEGIIGILAGKIAEKYNKPTYVFSWNKEKQVWKGSARTSGKIHLYNLTSHAKDFIAGFGGHAGAVGLSVKNKDFDLFVEKIIEKSNEIDFDMFFDDEMDIKIPLEIIDNMEIVNILEKYRPYGEKFQMPTLSSQGFIKINSTYKNGLHNLCQVYNDKTAKNVWFFNQYEILNIKDLEEVEFKFSLKKINNKIEIYGILKNPVRN